MGDVTADVVVNLATTVFVLSTMLAMGLELTVEQGFEAIGRRRLLARALLLNPARSSASSPRR